ncbi:MAG: ABC transporter permease [Clostridium sp.]
MKLFYYIKTTVKGMIANGIMLLIYFILFPILLAAFMGFVQNVNDGNPLELKPVSAQIIDEDNSEMSKKLIEILKSDEMNGLVNIVEKKPDVEIIIEKGYGDNVLSLSKGKIVIDKKVEERDLAISTLKFALDKYHKNLYVELSGRDKEKLKGIEDKKVIENITIDTQKESNTYEKMASSMIGFVIIMIVNTLIQGGYTDISMNLDKRINAAPMSKIQFFFIEYAASLVYVFIILSIYVMFFRILDISFRGNFGQLMVLVLSGTILAISLAKCISTLFGAKYGKIMATVVFMLPIIGGEIFTGEGNKIAVLTPTHYLNNAFSLYNLNGNLDGCGKWIAITLGIAAVMLIIAMVKIIAKERIKICKQ